MSTHLSTASQGLLAACAFACLSAARPVSAEPLRVHIIVPLCDRQQIDCGRGAAGDPNSLQGNLYWGAAYGAEHFLTRSKELALVERVDHPDENVPALLRELRLSRRESKGERALDIRVSAYSDIDVALGGFFREAEGSDASENYRGADLLIWAGHDRLMDVPPPRIERRRAGIHVAVLACVSQRFFGPPLRAAGAVPIALTRSFMAPEAYLLEAILGAVARTGLDDTAAIRTALGAAYARYQRISPGAASTVFARL